MAELQVPADLTPSKEYWCYETTWDGGFSCFVWKSVARWHSTPVLGVFVVILVLLLCAAASFGFCRLHQWAQTQSRRQRYMQVPHAQGGRRVCRMSAIEEEHMTPTWKSSDQSSTDSC